MMKSNAINICKNLQTHIRSHLSEKRYQHTLRVSRLCIRLAKRFNLDPIKGFMAALGHDMAKEMSEHELLQFAYQNGLEIKKRELKSPSLLHAKVGSYLAQRNFQIEDIEVLEAIAFHTYGNKQMKDIAKLLFICDRIEPEKPYIQKSAINQIFMQNNIDAGFYLLLKEMERNMKKNIDVFFGENKHLQYLLNDLENRIQ